MSFLTRYEDDASAPTVKEALRDLAVRVLAPGLVLFGVVVGLGKLIVASKAYSDAEEKLVNRSLAAERDSLWNAITNYWSHIGNTEYVIGVCVIVALIVGVHFLGQVQGVLFSILDGDAEEDRKAFGRFSDEDAV